MADNKLNTKAQVIDGCVKCSELKTQVYDLEKIKKDLSTQLKDTKVTNEELGAKVSRFEKIDDYRNNNVNPKFFDEAMKLEVDQDWKTSKSKYPFLFEDKAKGVEEAPTSTSSVAGEAGKEEKSDNNPLKIVNAPKPEDTLGSSF